MHALRPETGIGTLCAALLVLSGCATPGLQKPLLTADDLRITGYPYNADIHGEDLPVEIARFDAPAIHSHPDNSKIIELGFLRYPAVEGANGPPIVFLTKQNPNDAVSEEFVVQLRQLGDVVLLNRRGYGFSSPPSPCPSRLTYPLDEPLTQERLTEETCRHANVCINHARENRLPPEAFASIEVSNDLELLAQVLETGQMHVIAAMEIAQPPLDLMKRSPERIASLVLMDASVTTSSHDDAARDSIDALGARLQTRPVNVSYETRGGQQIKIAIGALDLAFLHDHSSPASAEQLRNAASAAGKGNYDALAELVLRNRQQIGQADSIDLLIASESGRCTAKDFASISDYEYAANWPTSAFRQTAGGAATSALDEISRISEEHDNVTRLDTGYGPDSEKAILALLAGWNRLGH